MVKIVIISLLATLLLAQHKDSAFAEQNISLESESITFLEQSLSSKNPKVYSALGNVIYDNIDAIEKLKEIPKYSQYEQKINSYVKEVYKTKDIGYEIEAGNKIEDEGKYLKKLRELSKTNDFFHRIVVNSFKASITYEDSDFFSTVINSGLIDTQKYKDKILEYYFIHCSEMNAAGVIQNFLDEDEMLRKQEEASKKVIVTKEQIQKAKIKRMREKDKTKQEEIQKTLEKELVKKKSDIRKKQVEELTKPN